MDVRNARATCPDDKVKVDAIIERGVGFDATTDAVRSAIIHAKNTVAEEETSLRHRLAFGHLLTGLQACVYLLGFMAMLLDPAKPGLAYQLSPGYGLEALQYQLTPAQKQEYEAASPPHWYAGIGQPIPQQCMVGPQDQGRTETDGIEMDQGLHDCTPDCVDPAIAGYTSPCAGLPGCRFTGFEDTSIPILDESCVAFRYTRQVNASSMQERQAYAEFQAMLKREGEQEITFFASGQGAVSARNEIIRSQEEDSSTLGGAGWSGLAKIVLGGVLALMFFGTILVTVLSSLVNALYMLFAGTGVEHDEHEDSVQWANPLQSEEGDLEEDDKESLAQTAATLRPVWDERPTPDPGARKGGEMATYGGWWAERTEAVSSGGAAGQPWRILSETLPVFAANNIKAAQIDGRATLARGDVVSALHQRGNWVHVEIDEAHSGWIQQYRAHLVPQKTGRMKRSGPWVVNVGARVDVHTDADATSATMGKQLREGDVVTPVDDLGDWLQASPCLLWRRGGAVVVRWTA